MFKALLCLVPIAALAISLQACGSTEDDAKKCIEDYAAKVAQIVTAGSGAAIDANTVCPLVNILFRCGKDKNCCDNDILKTGMNAARTQFDAACTGANALIKCE